MDTRFRSSVSLISNLDLSEAFEVAKAVADTTTVVSQPTTRVDVTSTLNEARGTSMDSKSVFSRVASSVADISLQTETTLLRLSLFIKGPGDANSVEMNDIKQVLLGDCWVLAPLAALAMQDPDAIKRMIQDNGDGTYTVHFKERLPGFPSPWFPFPLYYDSPITVTADFPDGIFGTNHAAVGDVSLVGKEIWPLIIEKAWAQKMGGYDKLDAGGKPLAMMEALTGRPMSINTFPAVDAWPYELGLSFENLQSDFDSGKLVTFSTPDTLNNAGDYNLVQDHCYALKNVYTDENGKQWVELYNPWGSSHPARIPYEEAYRYFSKIAVC